MSPSGTTQDHQALLEAYLRALNLPMFLQLYQSYAQDAARSGLSFERYLLALCEAESAERRLRRIEHPIAMAKFPFLKEIPTYDFIAVQNIPTPLLLDLPEADYVAEP